jgi:D-glycero-D-manno-heptose 1,7-bisphosphate phosphatase
MTRPAVFLDRDGTMIREVQFLRRFDDLTWFPSTIDAIRLLNRAGFVVCVTTNQSGVGRGYYTEEDVRLIHERMTLDLEAAGARVDAWFYCPHHPEATVAPLRLVCECRKPRPGMVERAADRFALDLSRSFVIGDRITDVGLAEGVGARGVLVRTGYGENTIQENGGTAPGAALVATNLIEATAWILRESGHPRASGAARPIARDAGQEAR